MFGVKDERGKSAGRFSGSISLLGGGDNFIANGERRKTGLAGVLRIFLAGYQSNH